MTEYERGRFVGHAEMYQKIGETMAVWAAIASRDTLTLEEAQQLLARVMARIETSKAVH